MYYCMTHARTIDYFENKHLAVFMVVWQARKRPLEAIIWRFLPT